jgi:hypothetical protein
VLEHLTGGLCDAITGRSDGQSTLETLDRDNLFVVASTAMERSAPTSDNELQEATGSLTSLRLPGQAARPTD